MGKYSLYDIWYSPSTLCHSFSFQIYAALFQWRLLIFVRKCLSCSVLEANKKEVSLKSYSLKTGIDSVNQALRNKDKIIWIRNINILTRITDRRIPYVYSCLWNNKKLRTYFQISLFIAKLKGDTHISYGEGSEKNLEIFLLRKRNVYLN